MNNLLRRVNKAWGRHYRDGLPRGAGCVAFVVDERCVRKNGEEAADASA